jgi:hypothetical protein
MTYHRITSAMRLSELVQTNVFLLRVHSLSSEVRFLSDAVQAGIAH